MPHTQGSQSLESIEDKVSVQGSQRGLFGEGDLEGCLKENYVENKLEEETLGG